MEVIAAAGSLCSVGCGAAVSAIASGPILSAVSVVAAVGYGIFSLAIGDEKKTDDLDFEDAIEGEVEDEKIVPIVKIAKHDVSDAHFRKSHVSFL
jgi:hypothetical protein